MRVRPFPVAVASILLMALSALSGCSEVTERPDSASGSPSAKPSAKPLSADISPADKATGVPVDSTVTVTSTSGEFTGVKVAKPDGHTVPGSMSADNKSWKANDLLDPGLRYTVTATGKTGTVTSTFTTQALSLAQQTFATIVPADGTQVGVGMPVAVTFDVPVKDHAAFEKRMHVKSTPAQTGSWHWVSDKEVRYRPQHYWKPGTTIKVDLDLNGAPAGAGIYGQHDRAATYKVGDAHVIKVNAATHQMKVFSNGKLLRTIPTTTGKPGFTTRSGIKIISEKHRVKEMRSETIGISDQGSSDYYDLDDVEYAMRVTNSGEFIHAAPWSTGSQGYANVSHGCTGISTANAAWLYGLARVGDVVETTGTDRKMEWDNGFGDWNLSWADYRSGSALH
ncbi:lipoprotein-anchoring transpeptidase ErfK/SrfK [Nocardioides albertanoniae]|uniref:Lipoprotein-anchoring transpeptidase ErfK/SrfK n=1 Tax=Nocardioides albertanoniae TaxID=1175486 RepID=A0A543A840_9ACTN|nr:Ig-like domain-containing protein [Nocardioides albertanoniae]TQL68680.1 lipoprotein-anchoring transpeptidase ErfK/SrfK [Nocardioides albertanoniae]